MRNRIPSPGKAGRMLITPESGAPVWRLRLMLTTGRFNPDSPRRTGHAA